MGVAFLVCDLCDEIYSDCGPYINCDDCEAGFCDTCMDDVTNDDAECTKETCPFCTMEVIPPSNLLKFVLEKFDVTQEDMEEEYREENKEDEEE